MDGAQPFRRRRLRAGTGLLLALLSLALLSLFPACGESRPGSDATLTASGGRLATADSGGESSVAGGTPSSPDGQGGSADSAGGSTDSAGGGSTDTGECVAAIVHI